MTIYLVQRADRKYLTRWGGWTIWKRDAECFGTMTEAAMGALAAKTDLDWAILPQEQHEAA